MFCCFWCTVCIDVLGVAPAHSALWHLAASCVWDLQRAVSRVRFFSLSKSSTASPSASPAMIWSRMFFWCSCRYWQNLQVFCKFPQGDYEVVKHLAFLLYTRSKGTSLPIDICFNGGDNLFGIFAPCVS